MLMSKRYRAYVVAAAVAATAVWLSVCVEKNKR